MGSSSGKTITPYSSHPVSSAIFCLTLCNLSEISIVTLGLHAFARACKLLLSGFPSW